jgi:hypothetical protein
LAEQRASYENQLRKQNETFMTQIDDLKNQINNKNANIPQQNTTSHIPQQNTTPHIPQQNTTSQIYQQNNDNFDTNNYQTNATNQVLSDATKDPRYKENSFLSNNQYPKPTPIIFQQKNNNDLDMFASEIKDSTKSTSKPKQSTVKKPNKMELDEILDSLGSSSDVNLDDVSITSSKKRNKNINRLIKPITSTKKSKNNSASRSVTKKRGSDTGSDLSVTAKRNNILKI